MNTKPTAFQIGMTAKVSRLESQFAEATQHLAAARTLPDNVHGRAVLRQRELNRDSIAAELKEARAQLADPTHGRELTDC